MPDQQVQRVFLHVGAPKTGTTFVQTALWDHREALREQGVLYPAEHYDDHFFAAVDLQQLDFHGESRSEADGAWARVSAAAREWPGTTVISHDVFASATAEQVQRAIADLAPAEVHVVYTARDLARQLPSHWQEDVKHGSTQLLSEWYDAVSRRDDGRWEWRWFWQTEELPDVLARWGGSLPPEHVHVVTVPPLRAGLDVLWLRFCSVVGIDPATVDLEAVQHTNTSLGIAEVELLRRVNVSLDGALAQRDYEHTVKGVFAHETLALHPHGRRAVAPPGSGDATATTARAWVDDLQTRGVDVVGDTAELVPAPAPDEAETPAESEVADVAAWSTARLLLRLHDERVAHREEADALRADNDRRQHELDDLHARMRRIDQHPLVKLRFRVRRVLGRLGSR